MTNPPSNAMVIAVDAAPGGEAVCVRITGDVDLRGEADLARMALLLPATCCRSVYVDLAGITFAGTSLINFLFTVSARLRVGVSMSLCGPTPIVRRIIELTGLDQVAAVADCLPAYWAGTPRPSADTVPADRDGAMKPRAPAAGLRLDDRYRLIEQIGSGGMSVVFAAHDEILQRQVAVKVLAPSRTVDPALARRLLLEARAVATLRHPHIAAVYDFGVHRADDDTITPYLVMEMLDGELLVHTLRLGRLPWHQAVSVCAELAAALAAAHAAGIVHHDVSPANVMLTSTGVKVLDFGISALIGDTQHGVNGQIVGTAPYLAPERLGRGPVTGSADVYAAGLILYRCLAGRLPWDADTVAEMLHAHARVQPRRLPSLGLPQAIEDACYQCLAREPHQRPSAAELARILSREVQHSAAATIRLDDDAARPPASDSDSDTMTTALDIDGLRRHRPSQRVLAGAGVGAMCGLLTLGYLLYPTNPQTAAAHTDTTSAVPCSITYITNYTNAHRFTAAVTVTSAAPDAVKILTLQFTLPGGESLVDTSPATAGTQPVANAAQVLVGQQGHQVLNGHYGNAPTQPPTGFTLNGKRCDTAVTLRTAAQPPTGAVTVTRAKPAGHVPPGLHKPKKADKPEPHQGKHSLGGLDT